jgi:hemolysin activation/secretion protein
LSRGWALVLSVASASAALAADPSTPEAVGAAAAQEQRRLQERERAQSQQLQRKPDVRLDTAAVPDALLPLPVNEAPCFHITRVELNGTSASRFQWALQKAFLPSDPPPVPAEGGAPGRCLGSVGINRVMKRVQNALIDRGLITSRIVAEPQDLRSGALSLIVVPGQVRQVRFAQGSSARATSVNAVPSRPGQLLNLRDIEQGLENFKRV